MALYFVEEGHAYVSLPGVDKIDWISVTTVIQMFHEHFDAQAQAYRCSTGQSKKKVYTGLTVTEILELWDRENKRATDCGSRYHLQQELKWLSKPVHEYNGKILPLYPPIMKGDVKLAPPQKLTPGIYPEHFVYLNSAGLTGQSDEVFIDDIYIDVEDHKTNKDLEKESYRDRLGNSKKMLSFLNHLDDCNFMHYSLQLSIYMYMIRRHNYNLVPRNLAIKHVTFELEKKDKYGFPTYLTDQYGNELVRDVVKHKVDYMEREAIAVINFLKENPEYVRNFKAKKNGHAVDLNRV